METTTTTADRPVPPAPADWKVLVAPFQRPSLARALWQVVTSLGSYAVLWWLMYLAVGVSWWLAIPLAVLAAAILVRVFIIFHDCGHGSFFKSNAANDFLGFVCGLLTFTPYFQWRGEHARHHKTSGDLDRRGVGDVWTMTVQEYLEASRWKRFAYRLARNPFVLFVLAPMFLFLVIQRFPPRGVTGRDRTSVWWMNLAILVMAATMSWIFGLLPYLILQLTVSCVASSLGVWLFYVQHQFEDSYWARGESWDYSAAALRGSSFYKLPRVLQWFSGNIGFHHIHHLSPRIPNYRLQACHCSDPLFNRVKPLTLFSSLKSINLRLWDESTQKLVGYKHLRDERKRRRRAVAGKSSDPDHPTPD